MSSSNGPASGACRLHLSEEFVCLERPGGPDERRDCRARSAEYLAALRGLAPLCEGAVTAVLPPGAFAVVGVGAGRLARLQARRRLKRALGVKGSGLLLGAARMKGSVHLVGLPSETMRDAVRLLGAEGIRVAALMPGEALLPGAHLPRFVAPVPANGLSERIGAALRRFVPPRRAAASAASALALAALLAGFGTTGGPDAMVPVAVEASGLAGPEPAPVKAGPGAITESEARDAAASVAPAVQPAAPRANLARPAERPHVALLRTAAPLPHRPAALLLAAVEGPAPVMASRSVSPEIREAALAAARATRSPAELRVAVLGPLPRPAVFGADSREVSGGAAGLRPMRRPGGSAVLTGAALPDVVRAEGRPLPRPSYDAARLAQAVEAAVAAAAVPAEGESKSAVRPAPRGVVAEAPARPAVALAAAAFSATPPVVAAPSGAGRATAAPVPVQIARAEPVRPAAPVVQVRPVRQAPPAEAVARGSGSLALIGVFGTSSRRHALVRLPNGSVQRVRPGDSVNGVQIAAVGEDSVRVRVNGRDGVLTVPD